MAHFKRMFAEAKNGMKPGDCKVLPFDPIMGTYEPVLVVCCEVGYLVAHQTGDPGIYDEISVDLVNNNDGVLQLATVGRDEHQEEYSWPMGKPDGYEPMHAYTWDGVHEDVQAENYIHVSDKSFWY